MIIMSCFLFGYHAHNMHIICSICQELLLSVYPMLVKNSRPLTVMTFADVFVQLHSHSDTYCNVRACMILIWCAAMM